MLLQLINLVGVFAFAFFGANSGKRAGLGIGGILACALLVAFGGGTVRELVIGKDAPSFLLEPFCVFVAMVAAVLVWALPGIPARLYRFMLLGDACGLAAFACSGAMRAVHEDMGVLAACFFAVLTAVGGGIMCDCALRQRLTAVRDKFYALPALILGTCVFLLYGHAPAWACVLPAIFIFGLRVFFVFCYKKTYPSINAILLRCSRPKC